MKYGPSGFFGCASFSAFAAAFSALAASRSSAFSAFRFSPADGSLTMPASSHSRS